MKQTHLFLVTILPNVPLEWFLGHPMCPSITERRIISNLAVLVLKAKIGVDGQNKGIDPAG
jgi:hypothetical protein